MALRLGLTFALFGPVLLGCSAAATQPAAWPPAAKKWFERAQASYRIADIDDADLAIGNALELLPNEPKVKVLASRVAIARLEFDRAIELLEGDESSEALAIRGRAHWYGGELELAADELEQLTTDPEVRDPWARDIAGLARRGQGRKPFAMSGGLLAVTDMPRVNRSALVVPLEVNGEPALGLIATNVPEAILDSSAGASAGWISLRFGERIEVRDVPALAQDLSGLSRQTGAPIKVLLGVHLLRRINPTFDAAGQQFVVRTFEPPPPPQATTVKVSYLRGGGMVVRSPLGAASGAPIASLFIDSSQPFPLALNDTGWKKAGVDPANLKPVEGAPDLQQGVVPYLQLGAFEVPNVPGVRGKLVEPIEEPLGIDLDGLLGAGLLGAFRVTLTNGGLTMWLEDLPPELTAGPPAPPPDTLPTPPPAPGQEGLDTGAQPPAPRLAPPTLPALPVPPTGVAPAPPSPTLTPGTPPKAAPAKPNPPPAKSPPTRPAP